MRKPSLLDQAIAYAEADPNASVRYYRKYTGAFSIERTTRDGQVVKRLRVRRRYQSVTEHAIENGMLEIQQANGRYTDIRNVLEADHA
jgi:hypothetical protein